MSLKKYQSKRNFKVTAEPKGNVKTVKNTKKSKNDSSKKDSHPLLYVIQKHAASHLHYDLRLEMRNVLKSWAIPKGPHLNPNIKRLAVEVEDHPIEYGSFEGTIPAGEYGAGTVMLWDNGHWIPEGDPVLAYQKGDMTFQIKGKKLKGEWKLIRIKTNGDSNKKHWLFFKINDSQAKEDYSIVDKKPLSALTHKNLDEIKKTKNDQKTSSKKNNKLKTKKIQKKKK